MPKIIEGHYNGEGKKISIVVSRFNSFLTDKLLIGALDALSRHGVRTDDISIFKVPGAFEIPSMCAKIVNTNKHDAIIALGALIRGDTPHFDFISAEVTKGIAHVALNASVPVIFGVLTTDTIEQAEIRSGAKGTNKGFEAAMSALEMINLYKNL